MDLETVLINNIHIPYLLCWYRLRRGVKTHSYFINHSLTQGSLINNLFVNILDMITRAMKDINSKKYKNKIIIVYYLGLFSKA
jgi:hypothetical protein